MYYLPRTIDTGETAIKKKRKEIKFPVFMGLTFYSENQKIYPKNVYITEKNRR